WYVVNNTRGSASLIRESLQNIGGTLALTSTEVVDNVVGFNLQYLSGTGTSAAYRPADEVTDWGTVSAMRISLTLESEEVVGDDGVSKASRSYLHTVDIRGRRL